MDRSLIDEKLESLRRCIRRLLDKRPNALNGLAGDLDLQDIVAINLERAVQACVDLAAMVIADLELTPPETMAESFDALHSAGIIGPDLAERMKKAVGFRNIAVHSYRKIDWEIVFTILHRHLVRYDTAHGIPHRDVLNHDGDIVSNDWLFDMTFDEALTLNPAFD